MKKFLLFTGGLAVLVLIFSLVVFFNEREEKPRKTTENIVAVSPVPTELVPEHTEMPEETPSEAEREIKALMDDAFSGVSGTCHWGVYTFGDVMYCRNDTASVPSASVIKLFIMEYVFDRMNVGELEYDSTIAGTRVKTLLENMITVSDNSATNAFIDYFGMDTLNAYFAAEGYADTRLERRMLDYDAMAAGKENYTSVWDVTQFLKKVYNNQSEWTCADMLGILKRQQVKTKIPRKLPGGVTVAHKTGELSTVENDVGIIFTEKMDFAVVFLCSDLSSTNGAREAISSASRELYDYLTK
ncbi:MAG: serine hydrolase [Clostridia bacterium]|nr:serine hydrolase [Clostridia bacterium]